MRLGKESPAFMLNTNKTNRRTTLGLMAAAAVPAALFAAPSALAGEQDFTLVKEQDLRGNPQSSYRSPQIRRMG